MLCLCVRRVLPSSDSTQLQGTALFVVSASRGHTDGASCDPCSPARRKDVMFVSRTCAVTQHTALPSFESDLSAPSPTRADGEVSDQLDSTSCFSGSCSRIGPHALQLHDYGSVWQRPAVSCQKFTHSNVCASTGASDSPYRRSVQACCKTTSRRIWIEANRRF